MLGDAIAPETEPAAESEIITVFAAKGGVGKTTFATNLGVVLAGDGHRVCVVDLSPASGDIAISLRLDPVRTLADAAVAGLRRSRVAVPSASQRVPVRRAGAVRG